MKYRHNKAREVHSAITGRGKRQVVLHMAGEGRSAPVRVYLNLLVRMCAQEERAAL